MSKLLKPLVLIVLIAGIAALILQAAVLFPKRTLIKERTQKLEAGIARVVGTLKGSLDEETQKSITFNVNRLKIDDKANLPQIDGELNKANSAATAVLQGWEDTKTDLENTRQDLENTRAELERTKADLEDARNTIVQLNETIRSMDAELMEKDNRIAGLEEELATLQAQITDLNDQIASMQDQVAQLEEDNAMLDAQLRKCDQENAPLSAMKEGTTGKLLYVNPEWNFGVINVGTSQNAQPGAIMIIHHNDQMVGKVKIFDSKEHISVVEIMPEYQKETIKEGYDVLY